MAKIIIDPVTRVSGFLEIEVEIKGNKVIDAKCGGMQFRGFEKMLQGRFPLDAIRLTSRVCGICSTHHTLTSTLALEQALNIIPDENGRIIREITNGFEFLQNHLRHFYQFSIPDYVDLPNINPIHKDYKGDFRLPKYINDKISKDYEKSLFQSSNAHRALAVIGGKAPHNHGIFVGGTTTNMDIKKFEEVKSLLSEIKEFISNNLIEDVYNISNYYSDYFKNGIGYGNLMDYGLFDNYKDSSMRYCDSAILIDNVKSNVDISKITDCVTHAWFNANNEILTPTDQPPNPNPYKSNAYSWVTAPRYDGKCIEVGPLARMILSGNYNNGISTMDRIVARALEAKKICGILEQLLTIVKLGKAKQEQYDMPDKAEGVGLTGASRGALGHWISIENKVIKNYTMITPSAWNLSPMDDNGVKGVLEKALIGTYIQDVKNPVEIGRIARSFDPCLTCAAHITSDKYSPITIKIV